MASESKITGFLLFFMFLAVIIFTLYDIFRTEGLRLTAFLLPFFMLVMIFMNKYGIWSTWLKGKGFMYKTGLKATVVRGPYPVDNRRIEYYVSIYGGYLSDEKKKHALGGFWYFYFLVSQRIVIRVVAFKHQFYELKAGECDDPRGCVVYHGSPNDTPVHDEHEAIRSEVIVLENRIGVYETMVKNINLEVQTLSNSQDQNLTIAARKIKSITSQIDKPIIVTGGPSGGMVDLNQQGGEF